MDDKTLEALTFGFDIGIASVGWCVLGENRIVDLGVRCFDAAETPDKGESLNKARRGARLARRRLRRRAWRLVKLARLLKREGLIADVSVLKRPPTKGCKTPNLWQLRVDGLKQKLEAEEWARVIYHIVKHRGFHWISRAEKAAADADKEERGQVKKALAHIQKRMAEKGYRTAAELVLKDFPAAQRNKQGAYDKSLPRALLAQELDALFDAQQKLGNPFASKALHEKVCELFWAQKPPLASQKLLDIVGRCTFEKDEKRAPKASFTAERHVWLTRLNNLRIVVDGVVRGLSPEERRVALPLPYARKTELKYKHLRDALVKQGLLPESFAFASLRAGKKGKDPLDEVLVKLPAWQELRATCEKAGLTTEWQGLAAAALDGRPETLDAIAYVLTVYKQDEETAAQLRKLPLAPVIVEALLDCPRSAFKAFHALSLKALRKIVPHMEAGMRYDEACEKAGYVHYAPSGAGGKEKLLPPLYEMHRGTAAYEAGKMILSERIDRDIPGGIPRNPVVLRALNQARKVMNALIRKYKQSPVAIHVELARDLSRPLDERRDIEKLQKEYRDDKERDRSLFRETFCREPIGPELEKWRLYCEQGGQCAYSLRPLAPSGNVAEIFAHGATEIDHALPYSRSFDDSKNNKVLVLAEENRNKGNRTPYEYLTSFAGGENGERWRQFVVFVQSNPKYRLAKKNTLLRKNFGREEAREFQSRHLNDTRYIGRFFKNCVERYLEFAPQVGVGGTADDRRADERCVVLSGQLTAFLRARWGLAKVREESDRHHALDAAVIAACSRAMIKRLSDYARRKELEWARGDFIDAETGVVVDLEAVRRLERHFPTPWPHFRFELCARLNIDDAAELREALADLDTYPPEALTAVRPLFVSRAVKRRGGGAIHEATIRSAKHIDNRISHVKTPLQKLKLADLPKIVGATYSRNAPLIAVLRDRLSKSNDDGKKAFAEPVYKPSRKANDGKGSIVRSVKLMTTQNDGLRIGDKGIADLGEMHHVDVYRVGERYHLEPAYLAFDSHRLKRPALPDSAVFLFSLNKNDLVRVRLGESVYQGYFVMFESDGRMTLRAHDQPKPDKTYFRKTVMNAKSIEKFHVDVLGNIYPAPKEERRGLA